MPSDESKAPGLETTGEAGNVTLLDAINDVVLTHWSSSRLNAFIRSVENQEPAVIVFFTYLIKYVEFNRARYSAQKQEVLAIKTELAALKREVTNALNTTEFIGQQATLRVPSATSTPYAAAPPAPDASLPSYIAAPPASGMPMPSSAPSGDGTFTRRMDIAGNNVWVTFSSNDEIASK